MEGDLKKELLKLIRDDSDISDAIKNVFVNSKTNKSELKNYESVLKNQIDDFNLQLQEERQERESIENENKKLRSKIHDVTKQLEYKEDEMEEKDSEYHALKEKYNICKDRYDSIVEKYNDIKLKYSELDMIYSKYLSLGSEVIAKLERVLNKGVSPCDNAELFLAYGIQESNIVALWESIATNIDYYNKEGTTETLIEIFEYFITLYKEVTFKNVTINRPNEGDLYDERFHTRTVSSNAVGRIQEVILPGFIIGKNITKKSLVIVK